MLSYELVKDLSAQRLAKFVEGLEVSCVLGAHIEMKRAPGELYPIGTIFQPDEHALPLAADHIKTWNDACAALSGLPQRLVHDDFIIDIL